MLKELFPHAYAGSAYAIDYKMLYRKGFRAVLFDIDNTLVHHGDPAEPRVAALMQEVREAGLRPFLLSDNDEARVKPFAEAAGAPYLCDAEKPAKEGYLRAAGLLGVPPGEIAVIGDRIFTDIRGANRSGMTGILVKFIRLPQEKHIGKLRYIEYLILLIRRLLPQYNRLGNITKKETANAMTQAKPRRLFCEISPLTYAISEAKEKTLRHLRNVMSREKLARTHTAEKLPCLLSAYDCGLIKTGKGIDPVLQQNKAVNIALASSKISGLIIHPGETFSFWQTVGSITRRKGYRDGRILICSRLTAGLGGGLCNLANTIHYMVLHSPLTVTEFHAHSDALAPDHGSRVPFSSGTSVNYNYIDYRFRNDTDCDMQLLLRVADGRLWGELRSAKAFPWSYAVEEEDHHFRREGADYYRISKIYKVTRDSAGNITEKKLVRDNHSKVMFDPSEIPPELIRGD